MEFNFHVPKSILTVVTQLYEMEQKLKKSGDNGNIERHIEKMKDAFKDFGLVYEDPLGQEFDETRTDLIATISGDCTENLVVVEVIKPIIRGVIGEAGEGTRVVQKGIVVVEAQKQRGHEQDD